MDKHKAKRIKKAIEALKYERVGSVTGNIKGELCSVGLSGNGKYWIEYGDICMSNISKTGIMGYLKDMDFIDIDC